MTATIALVSFLMGIFVTLSIEFAVLLIILSKLVFSKEDKRCLKRN